MCECVDEYAGGEASLVLPQAGCLELAVPKPAATDSRAKSKISKNHLMKLSICERAAENGVLSTAPQTRGPRRCLPHMAPTASHEYLCRPLRVPAAYLGLLNFAASSKKYLSSYR